VNGPDETKLKAVVISVNTSAEKGTIKVPAREIQIDEHGVVGDAHAGARRRQVSMLSREIVEEFETESKRKIESGEFAENITTRGLTLRNVALLDRFLINEAELKVTQIGKKCHGDGCAIFREVGKCVMPTNGIFCEVVRGGRVRSGDAILFLPRPLRLWIITVSDRASRGEYEDKSGPRIRELLETFLLDTRWHPKIETMVVPDSARRLRREFHRARRERIDAVFTTGGTGVSPHDITPDVVAGLVDKEIPGIMEHIRMRFGADKPNALLSRGVAGVMRQTLIYSLPGNPGAVQDYMEEILKTFEHLVLTIHDVDTH